MDISQDRGQQNPHQDILNVNTLKGIQAGFIGQFTQNALF